MSRLPFELFLALRYLRPKRTFVSAITLISACGVMLGVAVLIIVISVMTGFDRQLRDKILGFSAHLTVREYGENSLSDWRALARSVESNSHVRAVAPFIFGQVAIRTQPETGERMFAAPMLRGLDPELEARVTSLTTNVVEGSFNVKGENILMGSELAARLRVGVGDRISVYSPAQLEEMEKRRGTENEVAVVPDEYVVRGIFDVGYYDYNSNFIITSLRTAQRLFQTPGKVQGLLVMLDDAEKAAVVRSELHAGVVADLHIRTWMDDNATILTALAVEKSVMFYILFFIVIVAAFGIMNSQITFVVQKTREIGMLKALGASPGQILWLFLSQSLVIGVVGVTAGLGLGMLMLQIRNEFLAFMRAVTGMELFPAQIYAFSELPAVIDRGDIAVICVGALIICGLAGLAPAWNAGRLRPVEALRHE